MNAEMYARVGGKALPEDNMNTVKVINFVNEEGQPVDPPTSLANGSVTSEKLADNSVTSVKIQDGSITGSDLANNAVTAAKIASGVLPTNATKEKAGLVKQAAHVNDPAGETPTKAEFIALRDALVTAGQMASA